MNDVKDNLKAVKWTNTVKNVNRNSAFPMLVKPTAETAKRYNITEDPVLLERFWIVQRLVAQSLEDEGAYVIGPQVDIPSEYTGTFKYLPHHKGSRELARTFSSIGEVASFMPSKVYSLERNIVYPVVTTNFSQSDEKVRSIVLQPHEQLTIIEKVQVFSTLPANRFTFIGKSKPKYAQVPCLSVMVESLKEVINLPMNTKGSFSTLLNVPVKDVEYDFAAIMKNVDLPINLITTGNCPKTLLDESFLQSRMQLRMSTFEEHEVILGATSLGQVVEFNANGVDFILPVHLDKSSALQSREQEIAYQTALQRFQLECQIQDSTVNIKDYQKSIRKHVSRNVRLTMPKPLHLVANLRESEFAQKRGSSNELTAIAFFSSANLQGYSRQSPRPPSARSDQSFFLASDDLFDQRYNPPLPPKNTRFRKSVHGYPVRRPVPPPPEADLLDDLPSRPPPLPPVQVPHFQRPRSSTNPKEPDGVKSSSTSQAFGVTESHNEQERSNVPHITINNHSRVPSPPHHDPPSVISEDLNGLIASPSAGSVKSHKSCDSDDIFGEVGNISFLGDHELRGSQESRSLLEDSTVISAENSPTHEPWHVLASTPDVDSLNEMRAKTVSASGDRSASPEFIITPTSYDNPAYESSPTKEIEAGNPVEDKNLVTSSDAEAEPVYGNQSVIDKCTKESMTEVKIEDQTRNWDQSFTENETAPVVVTGGVLTSLSSQEAISISSDSDKQTLDTPMLNQIDIPEIVGNVRYSRSNADHFMQVQSHESPVQVLAANDSQQFVSEELPSNIDGDTSGIKLRDLRNPDTNNNEIVEKDSLNSTIDENTESEMTESMSTMSGQHSISPQSPTSTNGSRVESEFNSLQNNSEDPLCIDENESPANNNRGFWISQYAVDSNKGCVRSRASFACNYEQPPRNWVPPEDLSSLSVAEVANSLRFIGMNEDTVEWFAAEKVDGQLLCSLEDQDITQHFHLSPFQKKKLGMFLKGWRPKQ